MSEDEALEAVVNEVANLARSAALARELGYGMGKLRTALKELLAAHRCQCNSCQKDDGK